MTDTLKLRIVLADDHVTVRHGLKLLIDNQPDMTVIAEASDGAAAVQQAIDLRPNVVVMDISMPGMNGLVATRKLKQALPDMAVVTLTRHADDAYLQELLRAGVAGYVLKQSAPTELLQAIRAAACGRAVHRLDTHPARDRRISRARRQGASQARRGNQRARSRSAPPDCVRLQQQRDRGVTVAERQDRRSAQSECDAEAGTHQPYRHRELRRPARLVAQRLKAARPSAAREGRCAAAALAGTGARPLRCRSPEGRRSRDRRASEATSRVAAMSGERRRAAIPARSEATAASRAAKPRGRS